MRSIDKKYLAVAVLAGALTFSVPAYGEEIPTIDPATISTDSVHFELDTEATSAQNFIFGDTTTPIIAIR